MAFLICSDEPQHGGDFARMNVHFGTGHAIEDLYALARCDYLIGPPSTFSAWASFYGKVPLYFIEDVRYCPYLTEFTPNNG